MENQENNSRRQFLKTTAVGAFVATVVPGTLRGNTSSALDAESALAGSFESKGGERAKKGLLAENSHAVYVDAYAPAGGTGDAISPFKTINEAIEVIKDLPKGVVIISEGDYRETLNFGKLTTGDFSFVNREGHTVRVIGSNKIEGFTKTKGFSHVYETKLTDKIINWRRVGEVRKLGGVLFEDGRNSREIPIEDRHPLYKNLTHRLPFTPIFEAESIEAVDAKAGSFFTKGDKLFLHTNDSVDPNTSGYSYENITRAANTFKKAATVDEKTNLHIKGIQFFFTSSGLQLSGFNDNLLECVSSFATPAKGAINPDTGNNTLLYCEAAFCDNDGFNGHFSRYDNFRFLSDNRANYPTSKYVGCWGHDNFDDGESSHEHHNVFLDSCLFEYNVKSGCMPSNDATYIGRDTIFRFNPGQEGFTSSIGAGFALVNPVSSENRVGCSGILTNCISYGNNIGFSEMSREDGKLELINCISRDNKVCEYTSRKGLLILRNCRATNKDESKKKVVNGGIIQIFNDEILS